MSSNGFVDPWRFHNPGAKVFSFYSHPHRVYSRIDYFFIDGSLVDKVVSSDYHPILISDHAPVTVNITFPNHYRFPTPWRFNSLLLSDEVFINHISPSIDDFININKNESVTSSVLWESLKAFLRGQIISYTAYRNRSQT